MNSLFYFQSDAAHYCVAVEYVESTVWLPALSSLDGAPPWLAGLMNWHGQSVPVIDFSRFMGHAARAPSVLQKLLILRDGDKRVAIIVDQVDGLEDWSGELLPLPSLVQPGAHLGIEQGGVLVGEVRRGDEIVMFIHAAGLLHVPTHWPVCEASADAFVGKVSPEDVQIFQDRMHRLAAPVATQDVQDHVQFAIVSIGTRTYAIKLEQIVEFTRLRQYSFLPGSALCIVGCMNLRGEMMTIVDVGVLAGTEATTRNASVVVLNHQGHKFSCLIKSVERLLSVDPSAVVALHDTEDSQLLGKSLLHVGSDVITILNLDAVIALCDPQQETHTHI